MTAVPPTMHAAVATLAEARRRAEAVLSASAPRAGARSR